MKQVIKELEGRELELIMQAALRTQNANIVFREAQNKLNEAVTGYCGMLELVTGDRDPKTINIDPETGVLSREVDDTAPETGELSGEVTDTDPAG